MWLRKRLGCVYEKDGPVVVMDYRNETHHSQLYFSLESAREPLFILLREIYPQMRILESYSLMMLERFQPFTLEENLLNDYTERLVIETLKYDLCQPISGGCWSFTGFIMPF